jgi:hypothetical protein
MVPGIELQKGDLRLLATFVLLSRKIKVDSYCQGIVPRPRRSCDVVIWLIKVLKSKHYISSPLRVVVVDTKPESRMLLLDG